MKTSSRIHAAGPRVFTSPNCPAFAGERAQAEVMDTRFMAGPDSLRRDAAFAGTGFCAGPGALESARHLSLRRGVRRNGTSFARDDPRLWRPRFV